MSITKNVILTVVCIVIPVFIIIYLVSNYVLLNGFETLENKNTERNLSRGADAIDAQLQSLENMTEDWSSWDDTYTFAQNPNPDFINNNMSDNTFVNAGFNLIAVLDKEGRLLYSKTYDFETSQEIPLPEEFQQYIDQGKFTNTTDNPKGIILTAKYPVMVVHKPILNNYGEGPSTGTLIMGTFIDPAMVESLSDTTNLALSINYYSDPKIPDDFRTAEDNISRSTGDYIHPVDNNTITGYRLIKDIWGQPALVLKVVIDREIYAQGITTVTYLHVFLLIIGVLLVAVFIFMLKKRVLSRLVSLDRQVRDITKTDDRSKRTIVTGKDELSRLSTNINSMLTSLEQSDQKIKTLYEQEKKHRHELEEETKTKTRFIDILAHELRTPLTPVILSIETLDNFFSVNPDGFGSKVIKSTLNSAYSLRNRLEELLDMARFSRGAIKLKPQIIDTNDFLDHVLSGYRPALEQKQQQLIVQVTPGLPQIEADPSRLEQVILNLLSNASKYSPENTIITIGACIKDYSVQVSVEDHGIGLPEEDQQNLFVPYHRVERDRQNYSGIGLGLAVSKQIIDAHKGKIWVESVRGRGSTFKFTIPVNTEIAADYRAEQSLTLESEAITSNTVIETNSTVQGEIK